MMAPRDVHVASMVARERCLRWSENDRVALNAKGWCFRCRVARRENDGAHTQAVPLLGAVCVGVVPRAKGTGVHDIFAFKHVSRDEI